MRVRSSNAHHPIRQVHQTVVVAAADAPLPAAADVDQMIDRLPLHSLHSMNPYQTAAYSTNHALMEYDNSTINPHIEHLAYDFASCAKFVCAPDTM